MTSRALLSGLLSRWCWRLPVWLEPVPFSAPALSSIMEMSKYLTMNLDNTTILCIGLPLVILTLGIVLRKKIPILTNCWFCHERFWMSYGLSNSWTCKKCEQYNGFAPDGGYNKKIDTKTPKLTHYIKNMQYLPTNSNGFCRKCNANQQLKIMQLASFVPMNENKFDAEIEAYKVHLEKLYQLCSMCRRFLKNKLSIEKSLHLNSKLIKDRSKLKNEIKGSDVLVKFKEFVNLLLKIITISIFILIFLDIVIHLELFLSKQVIYATKRYFYTTFMNLKAKLKQNEYFNSTIKFIYFDNIVQIEGFKQNLINATSKYYEYLAIEPSVVANNLPHMVSYLSIIGFCLQIVRNLADFKFTFKHFFKHCIWFLINYNASNSIRYLDVLQICLLSALSMCMESDDDKNTKESKTKNKLKNLSTPIENDDDLDQSDSENDDYFECSKFNNVFDKPKSSTRSVRNNDNFSLRYGWNIGNHSIANMQMPNPNVISGSTWKNNSELDKSISDLSLGKRKKKDKDFVFTTREYKCSSPNLFMPMSSPSNRSIISPSRLVHGAQQSWVAGGYWGTESPRKMYNSRNESSSSSQSSGFESFTSNMRNNMSSFPPSRDDSICSEYEISKLNSTVQSFQSPFCNNTKQNEPTRSSCVPYTNYGNRSVDIFNNLRLNNSNSFVPLQRPTLADSNSYSFS